MRPAASAGTRGELWAPHRRPSALKGLGGGYADPFAQQIPGGAPRGQQPSPQKPRAGLPGRKHSEHRTACTEGEVLKWVDLTSRRG